MSTMEFYVMAARDLSTAEKKRLFRILSQRSDCKMRSLLYKPARYVQDGPNHRTADVVST